MHANRDRLLEYRERLLKRYSSQAAELREVMAGFAGRMLGEPLKPGEWTPHQVLAHVWSAEEFALAPRVLRILSEDSPYLENWDEVAWMADQYDSETPVESLLEGFEAHRIENGSHLAAASPDAWSRTGRHPLRGVRTLQWWVEYAIDHTEDHLGQLRGH